MGLLADIRARDGNRCSHKGCSGTLHVHHRVRRSQCGTNDPANLITLCDACHRWVHANPYAARALGLLLRHGEDPAAIAVRHFLWPAAPVWLGSDLTFGLSEPEPEPAAA
jgi:hypothetical protein